MCVIYYRQNILSAFLISFAILALMGIASCNKQNKQTKKYNLKKEKILTINVDENKNRHVWQKPEKVVALLGDLHDKTVADIGSGTGYFTFRIALKAKKVIAIDIVEDYLEILENLKQKLPPEFRDKIETRKGKPNDPLLENEEIDIAMIINTFSLIQNKEEYLKTILKDLKPKGKIFIVDFKMKNLPIDAPNKAQRLPMYKLEELIEKAEFVNIKSDDTMLDYQYIVIAEKP